MHRTYSMRQSRAPTASQIQNPPPPSSSTKTSRIFGGKNIGQYPRAAAIRFNQIANVLSGHSFRKSAGGAFGPDLAKKLAQLVKMEKNVMRSMELVGRERMEAAVSSHPAVFRRIDHSTDMMIAATIVRLGRSL